MSERLIDTNILVYAYDVSETIKHPIAKQFLQQIWTEGGGIVCAEPHGVFCGDYTKSGVSHCCHGGKNHC